MGNSTETLIERMAGYQTMYDIISFRLQAIMANGGKMPIPRDPITGKFIKWK